MRATPFPQTLDAAHQEIQQLRWENGQLKKQLYGPSSERQQEPELSKEQILMGLFATPAEPPASQDVVVANESKTMERRTRRQPTVKVLETLTERIEPSEKVCPHCGKAKCEIGCERSERFEYVPAKVIRHEIVRPKLACPCGQGTVSIAPLPPQLIEQGTAAASLVAHVVLSKYDDHLPLYRQQQQFARLGVNFAPQTLGDWVDKAAQWLEPVVREMKKELLAGDYLQVDETPVKVLDPEVKGRCGQGYLWVAGVPGGEVIFEFHPGRGKAEAQALVGNFKGYLQRDGYGVYGSLARDNPGLHSVGCGAHIRRKFIEAVDERPKEASWVVRELAKLYGVERRAREEDLTSEQRRQLRQEISAPILGAIKPQLEAWLPGCLPQSPLGKAIRYALNEWEAWSRYLENGRVEIDNNLIENAIRPSAVGKKNWLFIGHPQAGWRSAVIYSVIVSCRRRGLDPWAYLRDVLQRLPGMKQSELTSLLPRNWKQPS